MDGINNKIYCGVVEDISDTKRKGRIKVRVQGIFDDIPLEDIPWASPYQTLSGKAHGTPAVGKLVNIVFLTNNLYDPYYIYSENYNINLQNKLEEYPQDAYERFISLIFDHKTQIYSDDDELTLDYKYNKITVTNDNINLELKDNKQKVNIGTKNATQQAMLGNHWLDWFDNFVKILQKETSLMGNGMIVAPPSPIIKPELAYKILVDYNIKRETFISDHVYITDDQKVKKLE